MYLLSAVSVIQTSEVRRCTTQLLCIRTHKLLLINSNNINKNGNIVNWLSMVLRLRQHNIGYTADGFYRSDDPTNSVKALKEGG